MSFRLSFLSGHVDGQGREFRKNFAGTGRSANRISTSPTVVCASHNRETRIQIFRRAHWSSTSEISLATRRRGSIMFWQERLKLECLPVVTWRWTSMKDDRNKQRENKRAVYIEFRFWREILKRR